MQLKRFLWNKMKYFDLALQMCNFSETNAYSLALRWWSEVGAPQQGDSKRGIQIFSVGF